MATANINWTFGPRASGAPVANCTFSVQVTRDGTVTLPAFTVTTSSAGTAAGVYQDPTASFNLTHSYRLSPQMAGCAANCTATDGVTNWNCAGNPPPPPPTGGGTAGCPDGQTAFNVHNSCGATLPIRQATVGGSVFLSQNFIGVTSVTVTPAVPGLVVATNVTGDTIGASFSGTATTAGTYNVRFTGSKAGCADCVITYPLVVGGGASSTQRISTIKSGSAYTPVSTTSFNSADQRVEVAVTGPPGQTFVITASAPRYYTSPIQVIPPSGTFLWSTVAGATVGSSTTWNVVPTTDATANPPSTPIVLSNPAGTVITGDTSLTLVVTRTASTYTITVTSPIGTTAVPFGLAFGGALFNNTIADCTSRSYGVINNDLNTAMGTTPGTNVFTFPVDVVAPYAAAISIATTGVSGFTHMVSGPMCTKVVFP